MRAESSAYKRSLHRTADGTSFTYIRNSNGPRIDRCGTPQVIVAGLEYGATYLRQDKIR